MTNPRIPVWLVTIFVFVFAAGFTTVDAADTPEACSSKDFRGLYAFAVSGTDLRNSPTTPFSVAGVFLANGEGRITMWKDTVNLVLPGETTKTTLRNNDQVALAQAVGSEITYTVQPNCQLVISATLLGPMGPFQFEIGGALADHGREASIQAGSPWVVGTGVAKLATGREGVGGPGS